jgi:glutathione-specific gamma-glutamylcyclotransferase
MLRQHRQPTAKASLRAALRQWKSSPNGGSDLWVFAYASLIWRPEFVPAETRPARVHGHSRLLSMWSTLNRGTPEQPGLVFALQPGGLCDGVVQRLSADRVASELPRLWEREMPGAPYTPSWLSCQTPLGRVKALAFTLPHNSPRCCGELSCEQLKQIFQTSAGRYGTTHDYAVQTQQSLIERGIHDHALAALLERAGADCG